MEPTIRLVDVNYTYPKSRRQVLYDINATVTAGEVFGLLGPSGAGKSTTQKILMGLLKDPQGSVEVLGSNPAQWKARDFRQIGTAFEQPNLYARFTARENLAFFGSLYSGSDHWDIDDLLARVGLQDAAEMRVTQFSKGMRVRLNVCRAFFHRPDILFLDEPTSGLDPGSARWIKDLIQEAQSRGATVFLSTHNMALAEELCTRVGFLVDGRLVLVDTPQHLKLTHSTGQVRVSYTNGATSEVLQLPLDGLAVDSRFCALSAAGQIQSIHSLEKSLDEIFIDVTGRRAQ